MIKYSIKKHNDQIQEIKVTGHADYSESGSDIVCASVSTAIILTVNGIEFLGSIKNIEVDLKEGYFNLIVKENDKIVEGLLKNLEYTFEQLKTDYKKYIKNQKKEG
ncbi:Predicted ribosomal protein [Alteracholeplasma palmae J233]|uniref:Ribosomal processing cysteine protease Prp n=1 Tax=Alteracholeplasma palmae (strain ATCC 49389 / J233) TaxID=1318466 RepID=U4KPB8_ALTPJ|nr:ribosomal-processing cysteine protease Prp [Alteracholeplasma palmae]CCV64070.1 Predicted ribosomal protein [Alteracholeplasma palmae J233]